MPTQNKLPFLPVVIGALLATALPAFAADKKDAKKPDSTGEAEYYKIITLPIPEDMTLECGGFEVMPDGKVAVGTRRGDVYMVEGFFSDPPKDVKYTKFATGLHESLGLAYNPKDGFLYSIQRPEITKLKDTDGDGKADVYETFCDEWAIKGDYHEYPFLSKFDKDGNLYAVLCLTGSFTSDVPWRGWAIQITPDGKMHPWASGIRSPGGMGWDDKGNLFYTDNQGPWNGTSSMKHLVKGSFQGNPQGNKWYDLPKVKAEMPVRPKDPQTNSRIWIEAQKIPEFVPPPIWLPHGKAGQSSSGIICDVSKGKFGPFAGQMFVADQHHSNIYRCNLETVNGKLQGAAFPFRAGFGSGIVPMMQAPDGSFIVGGTNRGWGSVGPKPFALERLVWTGKTPFEMYEMKVNPDGFTVSFTEPVDKAIAGDVKSYQMSSFSYLYRADYGSPEVDQATQTIKSATVSEDGKSVKLVVDGMKIGSLHQLDVPNIKSADGKTLIHPLAYYTLWNIPAK